jgi:hypothetical protein
MKSVAVARSSVTESTTKRVGFGYQKKSDNSPSTETARAEFLSLILEIKPESVFSIFNNGYHHFASLIAQNEDLIASLSHSLESEIPKGAYHLRQPSDIRQRAIKGFIPNWHSLQQRDEANLLQEAFVNWARDHNLTVDWCLDHALDFLHAFEGSEHRLS